MALLFGWLHSHSYSRSRIVYPNKVHPAGFWSAKSDPMNCDMHYPCIYHDSNNNNNNNIKYVIVDKNRHWHGLPRFLLPHPLPWFTYKIGLRWKCENTLDFTSLTSLRAYTRTHRVPTSNVPCYKCSFIASESDHYTPREDYTEVHYTTRSIL